MTSQSRPTTTLFLIESVDGKISSGATDALDVDRDWKRIEGVKEGLSQYYDLEKTTDVVSLNTGRVMAKMGVNEKATPPAKIPVEFIIIDNQPHLNSSGVEYLSSWLKKLYIATTNHKHPAIKLKNQLPNLHVLPYQKGDLVGLFNRFKSVCGIERITIQSGGTFNAALLRLGLIDFLSVVVAPLLVGGKDTPSLIDGGSIVSSNELLNLRPLRLQSCHKMKDSYLHLQYEVVNEFIVDTESSQDF